MDHIKESDWKLLKKMLPDWQEAYMEKLLEGYADVIASQGVASERFWELDRRLKEDKKNTGVIIYDLRRSNAIDGIISLIDDGVITFDDLKDFSDGTKDEIRRFFEIMHRPYGMNADASEE